MTSATDDPRVQRTRRRVIEATRRLMADGATIPVTISTIAEASAVARKTIYVHWAGVPEIMRDVLLASHSPTTRVTRGTEAERVRDFLRGVRDSIADPATHGVLAYLVRAAAYDTDSADVLQAIGARRATELSTQLGRQLPEATFTMLVGPLFFRQLVVGLPASDELIDTIVDRWQVS